MTEKCWLLYIKQVILKTSKWRLFHLCKFRRILLANFVIDNGEDVFFIGSAKRSKRMN